jgi:predicted nucleic acid-binding protein
LEAGIQQTASPTEYRRRLKYLLKHVRLWPLDHDTTRLFGTVFNELRQHGRVLSQVDMMMASLARQWKLTVLSADKDFQALPDIQVENWLS